MCLFALQDHIFNLMNRDTYARFLRSEAYKELLIGGKKKVSFSLFLEIFSIIDQNRAYFMLLFEFYHFLFFNQLCTSTQTHEHSNNKDACVRVAGSFIYGVHLRWREKKSIEKNQIASIIFFSLLLFCF